MVKGLAKSATLNTSKATKYLFIIELIAATLVDWDALRELWVSLTGATMTEQLPLLSTATSESWKRVECGAGTVVPAIAPGEAPQDGVATITATAEGVDETVLDWAYSMQGEEVVAVVTRCSDNKKFIFANPCTGGMTFQYQSIGSQDGGKAGVNFTLTGSDCPKPMLVYAPAASTEEDAAE